MGRPSAASILPSPVRFVISLAFRVFPARLRVRAASTGMTVTYALGLTLEPLKAAV